MSESFDEAKTIKDQATEKFKAKEFEEAAELYFKAIEKMEEVDEEYELNAEESKFK